LYCADALAHVPGDIFPRRQHCGFFREVHLIFLAISDYSPPEIPFGAIPVP
jgi:hypothetical protein